MASHRDHPLAPSDAFSPQYADAQTRLDCLHRCPGDRLGPKSETVQHRISCSCAGWVAPPTPEEFYDALRAEHPDERQRQIVSMWVLEATDEDIMMAWLEEVYCFRELAAAMHRTGATRYNPERNFELNGFAAWPD